MSRTPPDHPRSIGQGRPASPGRLAIQYRLIADLRLNERNPRTHSQRQIRSLGRSIKALGFNVPVLIDRDGRVLAGHGRVQAASQLGWTEVPTICLDHLGPEQARAFMIADNRLAETSTWNERLLAETLRELSLVDLDFELEAIGFSMGEIDLRIEGLDTPPQGKPDPADAPSPAAPSPAASQPGDLWLLGRHRLLCANALDESSYAALMAGKQAAMVFTDPPYNVPIVGHVVSIRPRPR